MFFLIIFLVCIPVLLVDILAFDGPRLTVVYFLSILIAIPSITVRRLHDVGRSGWWLALSLPLILPFFTSLPAVISIVSISALGVLCLIESGLDNKWGPNTHNLAQP
jgi:uncharacterized membrane protein YhaH (DUF805 family)